MLLYSLSLDKYNTSKYILGYIRVQDYHSSHLRGVYLSFQFIIVINMIQLYNPIISAWHKQHNTQTNLVRGDLPHFIMQQVTTGVYRII